MNPRDWRQKRAKLTLGGAAKVLGCSSASCVLRYERGEREAPNSVVLAYEKLSDGDVTGADLARVRKRFLRTTGTTTEGSDKPQAA